MIEVRDLIGKPYKMHGRGPDAYDCYGLAIEVCKRFGTTLPDAFYSDLHPLTESSLISSQKKVINAIRIESPVPGSVIQINIAGKPRHIGVYLGNGDFIHCIKSGVGIDRISSWSKRIEGYYTWQK